MVCRSGPDRVLGRDVEVLCEQNGILRHAGGMPAGVFIAHFHGLGQHGDRGAKRDRVVFAASEQVQILYEDVGGQSMGDEVIRRERLLHGAAVQMENSDLGRTS